MRTPTHAAQTRERCIAVLSALLTLTARSDETPPTSAATDVQSAGGVGNTTDAQVRALDGSSADAQASVDAAVVGDAGAAADVIAAGPVSSKLIDS